ncbi:phage tail tape measure protein [Marinobacter subterrani]|uniref:Uncharacterized protein n=1 Tax=Marinobacter subterrani TaxID=1658765 RepID=A0A0J7J618_9GAMM|nr:hypothetical protein [Marinobacter subterrani]KMQ73998.1 hypothetical protein Msub_10169 [Marinobacter subterrani]
MGSMVTSVVMELVDRVTRPVRRIQQSLSGLARRAGLDRLAASGRRVSQSLGAVMERAQGLGQRLLWMGGITAGAVWGTERLVSGVTDLGNEVMNAAERVGVGTTWLQEWQYVGKQFGVQNDALVDGLKELSLRADEFVVTAGGPAAEAFGRLGIGVEELRKTGGDTAAMFDLVRSRLGSLENDAARQRVMDEIFGGQGGEQMVEMLGATREEIERMMQAGRDRGAILTEEEIENSREYTRQMGDLRTVLFGIQASVVGELLPAINEWIGRMGALGQANREAVASDILDGIRDIWRGMQMVGAAVSWAADRVGGYANLLGIVAGLMAGKFLLSLVLATVQLGVFAWTAGKTVVKGLLWVGRGLLSGGKRLMAFGRASLLAGAMSTRMGTGLIGLATRAVPAAIAGIRALGLALMATPIGWIIAGVTAVAGAVYLIYRNWEGIAEWFGNLWQGVKDFFSRGAGEIAGDLLAWTPAGLIYRHWDGIAEWFGGMWDGIAGYFSQGIGQVAKDLLAFSPAALLMKGIDAVFELFGARPLTEMGQEWIGGLWDGISAQWSQLTGWLSERVTGLIEWMPDWVKDRLGLGGMAAPMPTGAPVADNRRGAMPGPARAEVGGELRIVVDSEGRPRVAEARRNGGMDFDVESGVLGVAP